MARRLAFVPGTQAKAAALGLSVEIRAYKVTSGRGWPVPSERPFHLYDSSKGRASCFATAESLAARVDALTLAAAGPSGRMVYTIEQPATGLVLFQGVADSAAHALDLMADAAGYASFAAVPAADRDLFVTDANGNALQAGIAIPEESN